MKAHYSVWLVATTLLMTACGSSDSPVANTNEEAPIVSPFVADANDIVDPASHYSAPLNVLNVQLKAVAGDTYTIADVNSDTDPNDGYEPEIKVHFTANDYPDDGKSNNAKLRIRGNSSRLGDQKSYRVKLAGTAALWRGEQTLQLNKHPFDLSRVRNKLAFDLFCDIPYLSSLRTQFVHISFDDDANAATPDVDYGLYTHVEKMGKEYLSNRGFNTSSNIYKAADFIFVPDSRLAVDGSGAPVSKANFEKVLEIENGTDHRTLLSMIDAVNDESTDFNTTFSHYFNRNNYLTWLAVNILMGNHDTENQNFALYQPAGGERFYFLPWDYDGSLGYEDQPDVKLAGSLYDSWQLGLANWWGIPLHRRFIEQPGNLDAIINAVRLLRRDYLSSAQIKTKTDSYKALVQPLVLASPDIDHLPTLASDNAGRQTEWNTEYTRLSGVVETNYQRFMSELQKPMPFFQAATISGADLVLSWDKATDLQNDAVSYSLQIASQPDFATGSIKLSRTTSDLSATSSVLPAGTYYMKVIATDSKGHSRAGFDRVSVSGQTYFGVYEFSIP
ncbi:MAG: CotH kinase family protein [Pedobacter sp.]|nr:CotH kinase family protein [Pedobacter sp.]